MSSVSQSVPVPSMKCVCQLCTCGCHRCSHLPTRPYGTGEKQCMLSEYMQQYPLHPSGLPRCSFKPKKKYKMQNIPMESITTTMKDYKSHKVLPRKCKPPEKYVKSGKNMDLTSTYNQDYNSFRISRVLPCLPHTTSHIPNTKMDTGTTYKGDYMLWNAPKTEPIKPKNRFRPSEKKFDHRTAVQDDYLFRGPVATQSCKPPSLVQKSKTPSASTTSYKLHYVPHPLKKRYVHKYEKYKVNKEPFNALTSHKASYKGLAGQPAKLAKPYQPKILHDLPFSSTTEFQEAYQPWPQDPVVTKKPDVYHPPLEKMELRTTTQIDYKHKKGSPAKTCRNLPQLKQASGVFKGSSITKEDYKPWLCERQKPITHAPELTPPAKPMDFLTTFQSHYVPHSLTVTKNYKPEWSGPKHHALLEAETTYATCYKPKGVVKCLASYKNPPGYIFKGTDTDGHHLYVPASACREDTEGK